MKRRLMTLIRAKFCFKNAIANSLAICFFAVHFSAFAQTNILSLGEALDDPSLAWSTGPYGGWNPQSAVTHDGAKRRHDTADPGRNQPTLYSIEYHRNDQLLAARDKRFGRGAKPD